MKTENNDYTMNTGDGYGTTMGVKTEVKEITREICQRWKDNEGLCQGNCYFKGSALKECSKPEPDESQKDLWNEVDNMIDWRRLIFDIDQAMKEFTIQRKK